MTSLSMQRIFRILPWLTGPLCCGLLALFLGQDASWDLRNYHFYNPYAFLHDRLDYDVVPAQVATFYNPLLYIPFYLAVTHLPPMLAGFLIGAVQGLNFPLLLAIARSVMKNGTTTAWWLAFLVSLLGLLGAGNISELGTMFSDNLTSLLILGSLLLLLQSFPRLGDKRLNSVLPIVLAAGLMVGIATGFKQPSAVFAVGWCAAFLVTPLPVARRISLAFFFGIGVLCGIAAGGGYWLHEMWSRFGNPFFPYFNHIFQSPMAAVADYRDFSFLPRSLVEALLFPFVFTLDPWRTGEIPFRDLRLPLFMLLLAVSVVAYLLGKTGGHAAISSTPAAPDVLLKRHKKRYLLAGSLVAYAAWLKIFCIYRYLLPLEMLTPLGIWLLLDMFPWQQRLKNYAGLACAVLLLVTLQPGNWRRVSWDNDYFGVTPPPLADPARTMVLMAGHDPMSYVIPFFPAPVRFVRIQSYFTGPSANPNGYDHLIQGLVAGHQGPFYVLYRSYEEVGARAALAAHNLTIDTNDCRPLTPHIEEGLGFPLNFCAVTQNNTDNKRGTNR